MYGTHAERSLDVAVHKVMKRDGRAGWRVRILAVCLDRPARPRREAGARRCAGTRGVRAWLERRGHRLGRLVQREDARRDGRKRRGRNCRAGPLDALVAPAGLITPRARPRRRMLSLRRVVEQTRRGDLPRVPLPVTRSPASHVLPGLTDLSRGGLTAARSVRDERLMRGCRARHVRVRRRSPFLGGR